MTSQTRVTSQRTRAFTAFGFAPARGVCSERGYFKPYLFLILVLSGALIIWMMEDTLGADNLSASDSESAHELRARCMNSQLLQEKKELREHVERLRTLLEDVPEFEEERHDMLEALSQSCAREQELKERLKEESTENDCIHDALGDLSYIKRAQELRLSRLNHLKREVFKAECVVHQLQLELHQKELIIQRKNAETEALLALERNCILHLEETERRVQEAEKALRVTEHWRARERVACKIRRKETPLAPVKTVRGEKTQTRVKGMLVKMCCFVYRLLFLFSVISAVVPVFSRAPNPYAADTERILDRVKEVMMPVRAVSVHHTTPLLY